MAYDTFPSIRGGQYGVTAPGSQKQATPQVLTANFGGRYSLKAGDGINQLVQDFAYKSAPLIPAKIKTLTDFLEAKKGYTPFLYLVPGEAAPRQFTCEKWQVDYSNPVLWTLSAQFEADFTP